MAAQIARLVTDGREEFTDLLRGLGFSEDVASLRDGTQRLIYPAGATIFVQNDPADSLFWISRGVVTVHRILEGGSRVFMRVLGRGDLLGISDRRNQAGQWIHTFSAAALSGCRLVSIPRAEVYRLAGSLPSHALIEAIERLNAQWIEWVDSCGRFLGLTFRERLDDVLYQLGARFGVRDKAGLALTFDLSYVDLAEMIGSSASLVRRLLAELMNEGELALRGSEYIFLRGGSIASRISREAGRQRFAPAHRALGA